MINSDLSDIFAIIDRHPSIVDLQGKYFSFNNDLKKVYILSNISINLLPDIYSSNYKVSYTYKVKELNIDKYHYYFAEKFLDTQTIKYFRLNLEQTIELIINHILENIKVYSKEQEKTLKILY